MKPIRTRTGSEPRKLNVFGWLRGHGGAGAVAAATALALAAVLVSVSFAATASSPNVPVTSPDEPNTSPIEPTNIVPWDKPVFKETSTPSHGAMPSRLPC